MFRTAESSHAAIGVLQENEFEPRAEFLDSRDRHEQGELVEYFRSDPSARIPEDDGFVQLDPQDVRWIDSMVDAGQHQGAERRLKGRRPTGVLCDVNGIALQK